MSRFFQFCSGFILIVLVMLFLSHPFAINAPEVLDSQKFQCVSYAPFINDEAPWKIASFTIPESRIRADLTLLAKQFNCVRLYSITGLEKLPPIAAELHLKIWLGAWVSSDPIATHKEIDQVVAIAKAYPQVVESVIVGNEALLRKEVTGKELANYIREVKAALPTTPVTYADVWEFWLSHPEVAPAVDYITIHILPYWEDDPVSVIKAVDHVRDIRNKIAKKFPDKEIVIGETGWPRFGREREGAIASPRTQAFFLRSVVDFLERVGGRYNLIEAFDQPWKRNNEGTVGGYWGIYTTERDDTFALRGDVPFLTNTRSMTLVAVAIYLLLWGGSFLNKSGQRPFSFLIFASVALLLAYQFYLDALSVCNDMELFFAGLFIVSALLLSFASQFSMRMQGMLLVLWVLQLVCVQTGFLFDARYRMFPWSGVLAGGLGLFLADAKTGIHFKQYKELKNYLLFLSVSSVIILFNETSFNIEVWLWIFSLILSLFILWPAQSLLKEVFKNNFKWIVWGLFLFGVAYAVRYQVLESRTLSETCRENASSLICDARTVIGKSIYYQVLAWLAFVFSIANFFLKNKFLKIIASIFIMFGLVLYQSNQTVWSLILLLVV